MGYREQVPFLYVFFSYFGLFLFILATLSLGYKWHWKTRPKREQKKAQLLFRLPFMPWTCWSSVVINCYLLCGLPVSALWQTCIFCAGVALVFLFYSRSHSNLVSSSPLSG